MPEPELFRFACQSPEIGSSQCEWRFNFPKNLLLHLTLVVSSHYPVEDRRKDPSAIAGRIPMGRDTYSWVGTHFLGRVSRFLPPDNALQFFLDLIFWSLTSGPTCFYYAVLSWFPFVPNYPHLLLLPLTSLLIICSATSVPDFLFKFYSVLTDRSVFQFVFLWQLFWKFGFWMILQHFIMFNPRFDRAKTRKRAEKMEGLIWNESFVEVQSFMIPYSIFGKAIQQPKLYSYFRAWEFQLYRMHVSVWEGAYDGCHF